MGRARAVIVAFAIGLSRIARDHRECRDLGDPMLPEHDRVDDELDIAHDAVRPLAARIEPQDLGRQLRHRAHLPKTTRNAAKCHQAVHPFELRRIVAQGRDRHRGGDEQDWHPTLGGHCRGGLGERLFLGGLEPQRLAQCLGLPLSLRRKACLPSSLRCASTGLHVGRWHSVTKPLERASAVHGIVRSGKRGVGHSPCGILAPRDCAFEPIHAGLALIGGGLPAAVLRKRGGCRAHHKRNAGAMD